MTVVNTTMGDLKSAAAVSNESGYKILCVLWAHLDTGTLLGRT